MHASLKLALLLTALLFVAAAYAEEFVWRVPGKSGNTVYLVGSVHLLPPRAYPLAPAYEQAYAASEILLFETDLAALQQPQTQFQLLTEASYPAGQSLSTQLPSGLLARLRKVSADAGLPVAMLDRFKPWFAATLIELTAFTNAGFRPELGIDTHFHQRATADGKPVYGLEPLDQHLAVLTGMSAEQSTAYLRDTLDNLQRLENAPGELYEFWRQGDAAGLAAYVIEQAKTDPALYQRLVIDRNHAWLQDVIDLLKGNANAMLVVGALHLAGEQGLPALLRAHGYSPDQL